MQIPSTPGSQNPLVGPVKSLSGGASAGQVDRGVPGLAGEASPEVEVGASPNERLEAAQREMLEIRSGIRNDLEAIAERLFEMFGDRSQLDSEIKGFGKDFKEAVQAALDAARASIEESGTFDADTLAGEVRSAFDTLRSKLEGATGLSFEAGAESATEITDVSALADPSASEPQPGSGAVPIDPQVGSQEPGPRDLGSEGLRDFLHALFARRSEQLDGLSFGLSGADATRLREVEALEGAPRSYVESILQSVQAKGRRLDTAG